MSINIPGYAVQNAGAIGVQKNFFDFSFPSLTASSVILRSGSNLRIAPSSQAGRWFVGPQAPVIGVSAGFFQPNDFVIMLGEDGTGRTLYQRNNGAWTRIGDYTSQSDKSSSGLDGGDSDEVDAALIAAGDGGALTLTGSFDLSRPISLDEINFKGIVTIIFDNATIEWNSDSLPPATDLTVTATNCEAASIGSKEELPIWHSNPVRYQAMTGKTNFLRDLLLNASFN